MEKLPDNYTSKNLVGQPTKYKEEYAEKLLKHMARGLTFEAFASKINVERKTLYNWCTKYPEFQRAKDIGVEKSRYRLELNLLKTCETGKGNVIGQIFMLKNRFPQDWRDRKEIVQEKEATEDVSTLSIEEKLEKLEQLRGQLLAQLHKSTPSKAIEIEAVSGE